MSQDVLDQSAGKKLKELRLASGKSQEDLSFEVNIDQSSLSKGERIGPSAVGWRRFCEIAGALGYNVELVFRPAENAAGEKKIESAAGSSTPKAS
jgi:transcriptional regulator with XRE-family HTH domain